MSELALEKLEPFGYADSAASDKAYTDIFVYNSLKKGMGVTIGNALRRTLLSNVPGYAIKSLSVSGIVHEFSSIHGVKEDVVALMMNLKRVVFRGTAPVGKGSISIIGPKIVLAEDISCSNVEVVKGSEYICSLDEGAALKLDFEIVKGVGVLQVKDSALRDNEIGMIPMDCCFFSPVAAVNFWIEESESGIYEDLYLEIMTNGALTPKEAFEFSTNLLFDQISLNQLARKQSAIEVTDLKKTAPLNPNLFLKLEDLANMPPRALKCFTMLGIVFVGDLVRLSKASLMNEPQFGENSLNKVNDILVSMGLSLGMDIPNWPPENVAEIAKTVKKNSIL